jgi:hypothetical protein
MAKESTPFEKYILMRDEAEKPSQEEPERNVFRELALGPDEAERPSPEEPEPSPPAATPVVQPERPAAPTRPNPAPRPAPIPASDVAYVDKYGVWTRTPPIPAPDGVSKELDEYGVWTRTPPIPAPDPSTWSPASGFETSKKGNGLTPLPDTKAKPQL